MTKRICPNCGLPWYSADTISVWKCQECGGALGPECEQPIDKEDTDAKVS